VPMVLMATAIVGPGEESPFECALISALPSPEPVLPYPHLIPFLFFAQPPNTEDPELSSGQTGYHSPLLVDKLHARPVLHNLRGASCAPSTELWRVTCSC